MISPSDHDPTLPFSYFLKRRGVVDPCPKCNGMGVYHYSHGSTWRGGVGTAGFQWDICSECWSTGDKYRIGTNLRELEASHKSWEESQCLSYLAQRLGCNMSRLAKRVAELADICHKQANRRKLPQGEDSFWWHSEWFALGNILKRLGNEK